MDKGRRQEIANLKFKKNLQNNTHQTKFTTEQLLNFKKVFKSQSNPCSCRFCQHGKFDRAKSKVELFRNNLFKIQFANLILSVNFVIVNLADYNIKTLNFQAIYPNKNLRPFSRKMNGFFMFKNNIT